MAYSNISGLPRPPPEQHPAQQQHDTQDGELHPQGGSTGQAAFEGVVAALLVVDNVEELGLDQLPVEVGDRILVRVLVTLQALAFVTTEFVLATLDRNALIRGERKGKQTLKG